MNNIPSNSQLNKYDYNGDCTIDNDDVTYAINDLDDGVGTFSSNQLLGMQKNGADVTAQDLKDFMAADGTLTGKDIEKYVKQGGKLSQEDYDYFAKEGVKFTTNQRNFIEKDQNLTPASKFPAGTTPDDLIKMSEDPQITVTPQDLLSLKDANGKPLATGMHLERLQANEKNVSPKDFMALQKMGGTVTGDDLVWYVDHGGKLAPDDLKNLADNGTAIYQDDLDHIMTKCEIFYLTTDQQVAINPVQNDGKHTRYLDM